MSDLLKQLVNIPSPTGNEERITEFLNSEFTKKGFEVEFQDKFGNIAFSIGSNCPGTKILLSAHHDELGFMVCHITDNGGCRLMRTSGEDRRILPGASLLVLTDKGPVTGVIVHKPIHVQDDEEYGEVTKMKDLILDLGCSNKQEVLNMGVHVGTRAVFTRGQEMIHFGSSGKYICAPGLDDKIGVYCVLRAMIYAQEHEEDLIRKGIRIYFASLSGEESGLRGARVAARRINPDYSIDIDVTPSTEDDMGISKDEFGDIELGKGVVIAYGPDKNLELTELLRSLAGDKVQLEATRAGSTNTAKIQENALDCATALLSIPNKNMHQPFEICHWDDVEDCISLLENYISHIAK
jgi:endoglucanase